MRAWRKSISAGELNARNHKSMLRMFAWAAHSVTLSRTGRGLTMHLKDFGAVTTIYAHLFPEQSSQTAYR